MRGVLVAIAAGLLVGIGLNAAHGVTWWGTPWYGSLLLGIGIGLGTFIAVQRKVSKRLDPLMTEAQKQILCDPQTSGGLLVAIDPEYGDAALGRREGVTTAAAGHVDHGASPARRADALQLGQKEWRRRRKRGHGIRRGPSPARRAVRESPR